MKKTNTVTLNIAQHLPAVVKDNGTTVEAFDNEVEFTSSSVQELSAENVALWAVCAVKKWLKMQRLQRKTGLKLSKDVQLRITVNNRTEEAAMKFSLNVDRLTSLLERTPALFAEAFTMNPNVGGLTRQKALAYITAAPNKVILAKHVKQSEAAGELNEADTTPLLNSAE